MPDKNEQNSAESTPEEELEQARDRIAELEGLLAQRDKKLASVESRISELEQVIAERDSEITTLKQSVAELNGALSQAIESYRTLAVRSNPGVPEELIAGDTIEAIDESLANAHSLIDKVRQGMEAEIAQAKVPAGAPQRTPLDLSALSSREKIQYAVGGNR